MRPLSVDALQRFALKKGARLEVDGKPFNASRLQIATGAPKPIVSIVPTPEPAPVVDTVTQDLMMANLQVMVGVQQALEQMKPVERPRKWVFTVKRDSRGLISTIEATAKE